MDVEDGGKMLKHQQIKLFKYTSGKQDKQTVQRVKKLGGTDKVDTVIDSKFDAATYEGQAHHNKREGLGVYKWPGGFANYIGDFKNDKKHGIGYVSYGTEKTYYKGAWNNDMRNGDGEMVWNNGETYIGEWEKDVMHGYGIFTWPDGSTYEGMWEKGEKSG